jgi:thiol-disulfide isomerase/thioredoxin
MNRTQGLALTLSALFFAGLPAAFADAVKGPEPLTVSHGQEVQLADLAVPGKTTVFDFYSEFCPPCRAIAPLVKQLHEKRADIAVVEVDINRPGVEGIDWKSPVAKEFQLDSIPHFTILGPDGKMLAEGDPARAKVIEWLQATQQ